MVGRIMWKWTLNKKGCTDANGDWIHLAENGAHGQYVLNMICTFKYALHRSLCLLLLHDRCLIFSVP